MRPAIGLSFLKVGFLGFGGGVAMLPMLQEIAQKEAGIAEEDFVKLIAISQTFPGPMGVNAAAIIGYRIGGWVGALLAILGVSLPGLFWASLLFYFLRWMSGTAWMTTFLGLMKAAVVGVILGMAVNLGRKSWPGLREAAIGLIAFLVFYIYHFNPVFLLAGGAIAGYLLLKGEEEVR